MGPHCAGPQPPEPPSPGPNLPDHRTSLHRDSQLLLVTSGGQYEDMFKLVHLRAPTHPTGAAIWLLLKKCVGQAQVSSTHLTGMLSCYHREHSAKNRRDPSSIK